MSRIKPTHDHGHDHEEDVPKVAQVQVEVVAPVVHRSRAHAPRAAEAAVADDVADAQRAVEARAQRQAQRAQQRKWAKHNASRPELKATTIHEAFRDHEGSLDHVAAVAGAQRREVLQAATTPRYREHQRSRWDAAIALHEPMRRASTDDLLTPEIGPEGPSQWVSLTPERDLQSETLEQTVGRLTRFKSQRIKPQHATAHFVMAWEPGHEVTPGEAIVTSRRLLARVGIDPLRQLSQRLGDRRLHVGRRLVDIAIERELEGDVRVSLGTRRRDVLNARHRRKRLLERRRHRGRHDFGTRARQPCRHGDCRVVDSREIAHRQLAICEHTKNEDSDHDQRRHDWPFDPDRAQIHGLVPPDWRPAAALPPPPAFPDLVPPLPPLRPPPGATGLRISTFAPSVKRVWPSTINCSPPTSPLSTFVRALAIRSPPAP